MEKSSTKPNQKTPMSLCLANLATLGIVRMMIKTQLNQKCVSPRNRTRTSFEAPI